MSALTTIQHSDGAGASLRFATIWIVRASPAGRASPDPSARTCAVAGGRRLQRCIGGAPFPKGVLVSPAFGRLARGSHRIGTRPWAARGVAGSVRKWSCFGALAVRSLPLSTGTGSSCTARLTGVTGPIWLAHHRVVPVRSAIDHGERAAPRAPASLAARQASLSPRVLESTARPGAGPTPPHADRGPDPRIGDRGAT